MEHFPAYSSPDITNEGSATSSPDRNHAIAFAAAVQAAARVVRLTGFGRNSKEERAAILIQSYYRGYLVSVLLSVFGKVVDHYLIHHNSVSVVQYGP